MQLVYTNIIILTYLYSCRIDSEFDHGVMQRYYFALLLSLLISLLPNPRLVFTKTAGNQNVTQMNQCFTSKQHSNGVFVMNPILPGTQG